MNNGVMYSKGDNAFQITATDDFAGVQSIFYGVDGGEMKKYADALQFAQEADYRISYYAEDYVGNASAPIEIRLVIDNTPPVTELKTNLPLIEIDGQYYADQRYVFSWLPTDTRSGVAATTIYVDGKLLEAKDLPYSFTEDGEHSIAYYSVDNVGNVEQRHELSLITPIPDRTPPVTTLVKSYDPYSDGSKDYYRSDVRFKLRAADVLGDNESYASGVKITYCSVDGGDTIEYDGGEIIFADEGPHSVSFYSIDNAGNNEDKKTYVFIIDDTPPNVTVSTSRSVNVYLSGTLYVKASDEIILEAVDQYCGLKTIYYKIDGAPDFQPYEKPLKLNAGAHTIEYYSEDHLGNKNEIKKLAIEATPDYNTVSFETAAISNYHGNIAGFDLKEDQLAYLKGNPSGSHIYVAPAGHKGGLFSDLRRISIHEAERHELALGLEYIATAETRDKRRDIYLYENNGRKQYGQRISSSGINSNPIIIGNRIYWLKKTDYEQNLMEFDPIGGKENIVFQTTNEIRLIQKCESGFFFIENSEATQKIYAMRDNGCSVIYENDYLESNAKIVDFSANDQEDLLAFEIILNESHYIVINNAFDNRLFEITRFEGRKPVVRDIKVYFIDKKDNTEILTSYDVINNGQTRLLKAVRIKGFIMNGNGDILIDRIYNFSYNFELFYYITFGKILPLPWFRLQFPQLVFLKNTRHDAFIGRIAYDDGRSDFTYNSDLDNDDFLYADMDIILKNQLTFVNDDFQGIQTFDGQKNNDAGVSLSFRALNDITLYVLIDKTADLDSMKPTPPPDANNSPFPDDMHHTLRIGDMNNIKFLTYRVRKDETFVLRLPKKMKFAPIILISNKDGFKKHMNMDK